MNVQLDPEQQRRLEAAAAERGVEVDELAKQLINAGLSEATGNGASASGFGFFDDPSLDELTAVQGSHPVTDLASLAASFPPEERNADDFLEFRRELRNQ